MKRRFYPDIRAAGLAALTGLLLFGCSSTRLSRDPGTGDQPVRSAGQGVASGGNPPPVSAAVGERFEPPAIRFRAADDEVLEIIRRRRDLALARSLAAEGLALFRQKKFRQALDKYHRAEKLLMSIPPMSCDGDHNP